MDTEKGLELLRAQLVATRTNAPFEDFNAWRERTSTVMRHVMGDTHTLTVRFEDVHYSPIAWTAGDTYALDSAKQAGVTKVCAILEAAIFELELREPEETATESLVDVELWSKIEHLVVGHNWDQVVSQSVIFFEHWVRRRAGLPNDLVGVDLMRDAFKAGGPLALAIGESASETEGWHLLARGLTQAVRNVAGHRIEERPDAKTYAMGVLGTVSLLMTQVRLEHPTN